MTMTKFSRINKQREEITMRVLEDMEKGGNEWKKPWVEASPLPPHNPVCRSTTIKSCWRPLKIISDAERVITGRQAT